MLICKICKICIYLYCSAYCTYFAYEIYIAQLHLIWSEDAVNTDTTPVQRDRRQAQRGVRCIMVFIQKTSNFIRKHRKHCILAQLFSITMQNFFLWLVPRVRILKTCNLKRRRLFAMATRFLATTMVFLATRSSNDVLLVNCWHCGKICCNDQEPKSSVAH